ncbi:YicC/YloC family endoribonuclease [Caldicellulosiruptor naganoensis]|uniref:YicC family protein n=1 Tax=Caldicellulosiruptor naganoensis TaxID=29324 RepID=A0ABY7BLG0_9FIRM|nr:YicC/YloC family endoribonuclease [Caldicellulosiruptor naganoensis]WAM32595.1 YicC family protein [Caldicellulosiruptor naganoensis]
MIKSMTGYGGSKQIINLREYSVDIRSVNHRYLEINLKVPKEFVKFESEIKNLISKYISRGKVDVYVSFKSFSEKDYRIIPNLGLLKQYLEAINVVRENFAEVQDDFSLSTFIKLPDALVIENQELDSDIIKNELLSCIEDAVKSLDNMRKTEGENLKKDILQRIEKIKEIIQTIEQYSASLVENYREKLYKRISEYFDIKNIDENRLMLEITLFADKSDITEELVRLKSHINQFVGCIEEGGVVGKKLDFIVQEMNREANTIGAKSIIYEISSCVVSLKDELEKIREQVQNIE